MRRALLALCALVIAAPTLILGPPATAAPGDTVGPLGAGADVSFPQQGQPLPEPVDFGIVGVNGRDFASYNPDLARQWGWAQGRALEPQLYVLSANPGSRGTFWGKGGSRACDGSSDDPGCAYDHGEVGAQSALSSVAGVVDRPVTWWVDVEIAETWRLDRPDLDAEVLRGEMAALQARPDLVRDVGVFTRATPPGKSSEWQAITGSPADLAALPSWLSTGPGDASSARAACAAVSPLAEGPVRLAQAATGGADVDVACPPRAGAVASRVTAAQRVVRGVAGSTVTVRGTGRPGSTVTVSTADLRGTRLSTASVGVGVDGGWLLRGLVLRADGPLTVSDAAGSNAVDVRPVVGVRLVGSGRGPHACTALVRGTTATWWSGQRVRLLAGRSVVGSGPVRRAGRGGAFVVVLAGTCGDRRTVTASVDGLAGRSRITEPGTSRSLGVRTPS